MSQASVAQVAVERHIQISQERARQLSYLAQTRGVGENQIVERALDVFFRLADSLDARSERQGWSALSEPSLQRIWDNEQDAAYDNWRELYDVPAR